MTERNIYHIPEKSVCQNHFDDNDINRFIRNNSSLGFCDYCNKEVKVVEFEELLPFMMSSISTFFEDAANFMGYNSREGGYLGEIHSPDELIQDRIGLGAEPFELIEDIVDCIDDIPWAEPDKYYDTPRDEMMYQWEFFKSRVKHSSRYFFSPDNQMIVTDVLKELGKLIISSKLIGTIPQGTKIYRCRQHNTKENVDTIDAIASPSSEFAIYSNRFSPQGISMLYSAFDAETAIWETVNYNDPDKQLMTVGEFETREDQFVIDFTKLPKIPGFFGIKEKRKYFLICFLHDLVNDFTKTVDKDGREHIEYIPTQIVTEYFRFPFNKNRKNKISGIVYPSSKNGKSASVFFWDSDECKKELNLIALNRKVTSR